MTSAIYLLWLAASPWSPANAELVRARDAQDQPALQRIASQASARADKEAGDAAAQYWAALAESTLAEVAMETRDKNLSRAAAEAGLKTAERATTLKPDIAEYHRIYGTLCGQAAAAVGGGIIGPGPLSVVLGTSGVVLAATDRFLADPEGRVHAFCHAAPNRWFVMGVMLAAAGSLAWFHDTLLPGVAYDAMLAEAESVPPGCDGLVFLPYLAGERTPHFDPQARGAFFGLTLGHDRGALTRAVLEGVAFALRDCLDTVRATGAVAERGRVSGGGSRSRLWLRTVASALEVPIEIMATDQGSAFGAALLGGVAAGVYRDAEQAAAACVRVTAVVDPVPAWIEPYREARSRFRDGYPALRSITSRPAGSPEPPSGAR